jgi:hypothetical protein
MTTVLVAGEGIPLLARLRVIAPDAYIICLTTARGPRIREQRALCDRIVVMAGREISEWVSVSRSVDSARAIEAVCAFGEMGQSECAAIAAELGLPWHSVATIRCVYDKVAMRRRLREAGLSSLHTIPIYDSSELATLISNSSTPLIVKPLSGAGSVGIRAVSSARDAEEAFCTATGVGRYGGRPVIAETLAMGEEFSIEAFSNRGAHTIVAITKKIVARASKAELGHIVPAVTSSRLTAQIHEFIPQCLDALQISFGPTHTEVIASETGVEVIETHTRCGGGHITDLVHEATGVDLIDMTVRQAIGQLTAEHLATLSAGNTAACYSGIFYLTPDRAGTVVGPPSAVPATSGDHLITLDVSELEGLNGEHVPSSNHVRGPYCIVRGSSPDEVVQAATRAAAEVTVQVQDRDATHHAKLALAAAVFPSDGLPMLT